MIKLLADIGGSRARFSFLTSRGLGKVISFDCDDFQSPFDLIQKMLEFSKKKVDKIFLAVAGPVENGNIQWTNRPTWKISEKEIQRKFHIKEVHLVNDVYAQGMGLNLSKDKEAILMNIGTGFGSCLIKKGRVYPCEFGLVLNEKNIKKESYLSASGLVKIYHELGGDKRIKSAKKIAELKHDTLAPKAYEKFYSLWGKTAANISTALMAKEIYLWGGLIPKTKKHMKLFVNEFSNPSYPKYTKKIPCKIVKEEFLTLKGLKILSKA